MIHKQGNNYFLFSGHDDNVLQVQHLFTSDNILGPYVEHPESPIYSGRDGGRNAGSLIEHKGVLYRPIQVCINGYGEQTSVMKIESMTLDDYKEVRFANNIINTEQRLYQNGGHQWNQVLFLGRRIVAIDYREKNFNVIETLR